MDININNIFLPDNKKIDLFSFVLDPLSVIIKLAIISNKPVGTKIYIDDHIIHFQEPGPFQSICRYVLKSNKTDIQYLYNPIEVACNQYLTDEFVKKYSNIKNLFKMAQNGLLKLKETYKSNNIICLCFNYFCILIDNCIEGTNNKTLFRKDCMTVFYTNELTNKVETIWTDDKIKIILNLINYLSKEQNHTTDVKSLEDIMSGVDERMREIM